MRKVRENCFDNRTALDALTMLERTASETETIRTVSTAQDLAESDPNPAVLAREKGTSPRTLNPATRPVVTEFSAQTASELGGPRCSGRSNAEPEHRLRKCRS